MSSSVVPQFSRAVVTGAAGFLGAALSRMLAEDGVEVIALDVRSPRRAPAEGIRFVQTDLLDASVLEGCLSQIHPPPWRNCRVFHLAAESHVGRCRDNPLRAFAINVQVTQTLLELGRKLEVSHFIYPSTALLYRAPRVASVGEDHPLSATSIYAATKLAAENLIFGYSAEYGLVSGIARLGNVYGPDGHEDSVAAILMRQARAGGPLAVRSLAPVRDFVYRDDVCDGLIALGNLNACGTTVVNLASGSGTSIRDFALMLCKVAQIPEVVNQTSVTSSEEPDILILSNAKAAEACGWRPAHTLESGLRAALNEY